jgi:hypothetical protein
LSYQKDQIQLSVIMAIFCAVSGKRKEALDVIKELEERYAKQQEGGRDIAAVYAGIGDKGQAFA